MIIDQTDRFRKCVEKLRIADLVIDRMKDAVGCFNFVAAGDRARLIYRQQEFSHSVT
jgi:hypothetical protein